MVFETGDTLQLLLLTGLLYYLVYEYAGIQVLIHV
jgi:hypothetical protein